jgi:hypothetical protein
MSRNNSCVNIFRACIQNYVLCDLLCGCESRSLILREEKRLRDKFRCFHGCSCGDRAFLGCDPM